MNILEVNKACKALSEKAGKKADVFFACGTHVSASLYTNGIGTTNRDDISAFSVTVMGSECDFDAEKMLTSLEAKWQGEIEKRGVRIVEEMALEIIRLTAEFGSCTDAGLRAKYGEQVALYAADAVSRANEMASNGPFSIETVARSNAA
jgi:hypothetical protein